MFGKERRKRQDNKWCKRVIQFVSYLLILYLNENIVFKCTVLISLRHLKKRGTNDLVPSWLMAKFKESAGIRAIIFKTLPILFTFPFLEC